VVGGGEAAGPGETEERIRLLNETLTTFFQVIVAMLLLITRKTCFQNLLPFMARPKAANKISWERSKVGHSGRLVQECQEAQGLLCPSFDLPQDFLFTAFGPSVKVSLF
jgi:hypothetical protein